jgi:hypothetical protein
MLSGCACFKPPTPPSEFEQLRQLEAQENTPPQGRGLGGLIAAGLQSLQAVKVK